MSKRILVVEDQPDNRQIIRDMLAGTDYEITEAEDGEQALAAVAKARPDLVSNCPSWTATRSRTKSRPIPRCDRFRSSPSPPTRWMGKNTQRERQDVMAMCRSLTARANYWRRLGNTCPKPGTDSVLPPPLQLGMRVIALRGKSFSHRSFDLRIFNTQCDILSYHRLGSRIFGATE